MKADQRRVGRKLPTLSLFVSLTWPKHMNVEPGGSSLKDTPPEVDERYRAMFVQCTEEEQLIMGWAMWDKTHW